MTRATRSSEPPIYADILHKDYPQWTLVLMRQWDAIRKAVATLFPDLSEDARQKLSLAPSMLKKAYHRQMLDFHPDRHDVKTSDLYHQHACDIQEAYRLLKHHLAKQNPDKTPTLSNRRRNTGTTRRTHDLRFGDFLVTEGLITQDALQLVLQEQHHRRPSFGSMAVSLGFLGPNELSRWLQYQSNYPERLGVILLRERRLTREQVDAIVEAQLAYCEPIGILLCQRGFANREEIEAAHDRFRSAGFNTPKAA